MMWWEYMLVFEFVLFGLGALYGLLLGDSDKPKLQRMLAAGSLFALFYIAIPLLEFQTRRSMGNTREEK